MKPTMPDYEGRYEGNGNGEDLDNYGSSPQPRGSSHGGADDYSDSKSRVCANLSFLSISFSFYLALIFALLYFQRAYSVSWRELASHVMLGFRTNRAILTNSLV